MMGSIGRFPCTPDVHDFEPSPGGFVFSLGLSGLEKATHRSKSPSSFGGFGYGVLCSQPQIAGFPSTNIQKYSTKRMKAKDPTTLQSRSSPGMEPCPWLGPSQKASHLQSPSQVVFAKPPNRHDLRVCARCTPGELARFCQHVGVL